MEDEGVGGQGQRISTNNNNESNNGGETRSGGGNGGIDNNNNNNNNNSSSSKKKKVGGVNVVALMVMSVGSLVYYHCAYKGSSILSLLSDVFLVLLSSLAILGLLFQNFNLQVPVDPLEWQITQEWANTMFANLANTIGAAESVLRVAATGHDKRLFFKVVFSLYLLSVLGRLVSGVTVAYAGLCLFCMYMLAENSELISASSTYFLGRRESTALEDNI